MNIIETAGFVAHLAGWGLTLIRHDTHYPSPVPENPKFKSPRDAVGLIGDGDVVATSGLGGNQRASILYWAIREAFEQSGHPRQLTVMNLGGHGGRGAVPGTVEELGRPGLCTRFVTGHFDTFHAMLDLAEAGSCELQCIPQGTMALLLDALGEGRDSLLTDTGIGTFIDPRVGRGSPVTAGAPQLVTVEGRKLRYHIPRVDVALFNAPAADRHGNLYVKNCAMTGETREIAAAAKRNGGRVIANVGLLVEEGYDRVFLPESMVDAVVYYPYTEQTGAFFHSQPWRAVTIDGDDVPIGEGLARARLMSRLARVTPRRRPIDDAVARLAAAALAAHVPRGAYVNIGVGLPEEVCRTVFEAGHLDDLTFLVESGMVGGLPAPGVYFGAAFHPRRIISSAEMFKLCYQRLDATCLGVLQADSSGNVNVSRRGGRVRDYVGPGGFIDLSTAARTVVFVSSWTAGGRIAVDGERLRIVEPGRPKFVERVDEVTFNGARALAAGKNVLYATGVGLFRLTARGMELAQVMPGIDVRRDILESAPMKVVLPRSDDIPVVPASVVTGRGFALRFAA